MAKTIQQVLEMADGIELVDIRFVDLPGTRQHFTCPLIALTGLAFVFQNNIARLILSLLGILLMLNLAWDAIRHARHGRELQVTASTSSGGDFANGAFLSLGNPLNIVFWTGLGTTVFASLSESSSQFIL